LVRRWLGNSEVAEHLALHLPAKVQEKTERGAVVAPANQKRLYLEDRDPRVIVIQG
jgi:hypothetical protein